MPTEGCTRCLACGWVTVPITIEPARITQYVLMDLLRSGLNDFSAWVRALCARWPLSNHILAARTDTNSGHPRWSEYADINIGDEPLAVITLRHDPLSLRIDVYN